MRSLTWPSTVGRPGACRGASEAQALEGVESLARTIQRAQGRIEVVLGGGINPADVGPLLARVP